MGVQASWELDLWGKFRRSVESADAQLAASVANYDDVLVSLTADLATAYIHLRTFQEQLRVAQGNVKVQEEGLEIATKRFRGGVTDERDVQQAKTILASTKATIPQLRAADRADPQLDRDPDRPAAQPALRPARSVQGHPAAAGAGRRRHPGRPVAAPAGHPAGGGHGRCRRAP